MVAIQQVYSDVPTDLVHILHVSQVTGRRFTLGRRRHTPEQLAGCKQRKTHSREVRNANSNFYTYLTDDVMYVDLLELRCVDSTPIRVNWLPVFQHICCKKTGADWCSYSVLSVARIVSDSSTATGRPRGYTSSKWLAVTDRVQFITHHTSRVRQSGRYFITHMPHTLQMSLKRDVTSSSAVYTASYDWDQLTVTRCLQLIRRIWHIVYEAFIYDLDCPSHPPIVARTITYTPCNTYLVGKQNWK